MLFVMQNVCPVGTNDTAAAYSRCGGVMCTTVANVEVGCHVSHDGISSNNAVFTAMYVQFWGSVAYAFCCRLVGTTTAGEALALM